VRYDLFGPKDSSKRISIFYLAMPTAIYHTSHYVLTEISFNVIYGLARRRMQRKPARDRTIFDEYFPSLFARFTSHIFADAMLYPIETVLHRLYIQGTRTLIDNLDSGLSAVSIDAKYAGFVHCFRSIIHKEGFFALYNGIGAVAMQYLLHFFILRFIRLIFDQQNHIVVHSSNQRGRVSAAAEQLGASSFPTSPLMLRHQQSEERVDGHYDSDPM